MANNGGNSYQVGTNAAASTARRVLNAIAQVVGFQPFVTASLTTALAGSNNDLTYTAQKRGVPGNSVTVTYVVAGASTPLSVSVSGNDITVNVATSAGSTATSTAAQVTAAVQASAAASALVLVGNAPANDGTGVVTALAQTPLAGGTDAAIGTTSNAPPPKAFGAGIPIHNSYN